MFHLMNKSISIVYILSYTQRDEIIGIMNLEIHVMTANEYGLTICSMFYLNA